MAVGTPVLCNARSEVLVEHCLKSNAGLFYADRDEFIECANLLLGDERMRRSMGRNGKEYIKRNYRWDVILSSTNGCSVGSVGGNNRARKHRETGELRELQIFSAFAGRPGLLPHSYPVRTRYSSLNATTGSIAAARRAGSQHANTATATNSTAIAAYVEDP